MTKNNMPHITLKMDSPNIYPRGSRVTLNGVDITNGLVSITIEAGVNKVNMVYLQLVSTLDVEGIFGLAPQNEEEE